MVKNSIDTVPFKCEEVRLYKASPRGIGVDYTNGCICCDADASQYMNNCSFFVPSRETGEAIVALFQRGARLDYRKSEPNWIQVKIGACDVHKKNIEWLYAEVSKTKDHLGGPGISQEMVAICTKPI